MDRRQGEGKGRREKNKLEVKRKLGREIQAMPTLPAWWVPATQGTDMGPMGPQTVRDTAPSQTVLHQDFPQFRGSVLPPKDPGFFLPFLPTLTIKLGSPLFCSLSLVSRPLPQVFSNIVSRGFSTLQSAYLTAFVSLTDLNGPLPFLTLCHTPESPTPITWCGDAGLGYPRGRSPAGGGQSGVVGRGAGSAAALVLAQMGGGDPVLVSFPGCWSGGVGGLQA